MTDPITIFLASGAGAFIGGCIGSWLVTRWQFDRIRELEDDVVIIEKALVRILRKVPL
jgi:hypothetical protein